MALLEKILRYSDDSREIENAKYIISNNQKLCSIKVYRVFAQVITKHKSNNFNTIIK